MPKKGWRDTLLRVKNEVKNDQVPIVAAGLAFYALLSLFPALIAVVTIYGLLMDPAEIQQQVSQLSGILPASARDIVSSQLAGIAGQSRTGLGVGLVLSLVAALWSASSGTKQLIESINLAYDEEETRGFFKLRGLALLFTVGFMAFAIIALLAVALLPALFGRLGLGGVGISLVSWGRWPVLAVGVVVGLAILYRYAPDRDHPKWRWVSWGAVIATVLWLAASIGFSVYASESGKFNETYGALAGVIVLLLWFYISGFAVLLGAELDSELEHQTRRDTTVGRREPMGVRGAAKADTLGEVPGRGGEERPRQDGGPEGNGHRPPEERPEAPR